jgi:HD-like signal output (HDOD) protein
MKTLVSEHEIYIKLRALMEDQNSAIEDFCDVLSCSHSLTSAILKFVNSNFFGLPNPIDNIKCSITLLGVGQLFEIIAGIYETSLFESSNNLTHTTAISLMAPDQSYRFNG